MSSPSSSSNPEWKDTFIELALRALRRVHFDYAAWNLGSPDKIDLHRLKGLNQGQGFELADERAVCSAIVTELITTRGMHGIIGRDGDERTWTIDIEHNYTAEHRKRADIWIRRKGRNAADQEFEPVYIEAKRAVRHRMTVDPEDAPKGVSIEDDIVKLKAEMARERIFAHILAWGTTRDTKYYDRVASPQDYSGTHGLKPQTLRWFPVEVDENKQPSSPPSVKHWGRVALAEVCP